MIKLHNTGCQNLETIKIETVIKTDNRINFSLTFIIRWVWYLVEKISVKKFIKPKFTKIFKNGNY